jgi:hypothetical protein
LQFVDISTSIITGTHEFKEAEFFCDIIAIDKTLYLIAAFKGVLKATKDQVIKHYYKGKSIRSLCHITDSIYLVGFGYDEDEDGLIVWDEEKD